MSQSFGTIAAHQPSPAFRGSSVQRPLIGSWLFLTFLGPSGLLYLITEAVWWGELLLLYVSLSFPGCTVEQTEEELDPISRQELFLNAECPPRSNSSRVGFSHQAD